MNCPKSRLIRAIVVTAKRGIIKVLVQRLLLQECGVVRAVVDILGIASCRGDTSTITIAKYGTQLQTF